MDNLMPENQHDPLESKIDNIQLNIDKLEHRLDSQNRALTKLNAAVSGDHLDSIANQMETLTGLVFDVRDSLEQMRTEQQNQMFSVIAAALVGVIIGTGVVFSHLEVPVAKYFRQLAIVQSQ